MTRLFFLILNILMFFTYANAQLHGVVKDKTGNVIPGVNVHWYNQPISAVTDIDGHFSIHSNDSVNKLILSNVAYKSDTITVDNTQAVTQGIYVTLDDIKSLKEVEVSARSLGVLRNHISALNVETITSNELRKAACCNLSESFETNASVDVAYDDAVTGAKQIKLLGLSGKYVQMLTENIPNLRGLSSTYGLDYIPGQWMESIQVSKGTASVKNGYEAIVGQINVEYKKPKTAEPLFVNIYTNNLGRAETNVTSAIKVNNNLYTGIFLHASNDFTKLDENKDGFIDMPLVRQYNVANRWHYEKEGYIMQAMIKAISEKRTGGSLDKSYKIGVNTDRYEFSVKNGFLFNNHKNGKINSDNEFYSSLGIILNGSVHNQNAEYGLKNYNGKQNNFYANLIYDMNYGKMHKLSVGTSFNADIYKEEIQTGVLENYNRNEYTPGAFAEYSLLYKNLTALAGLRIDHNSQFGTFVTPRLHLRYGIKDNTYLRLSVGRGFRTPNILAENNFYLASNRKMIIQNNPNQAEEAWNYGITLQNLIPILTKQLSLRTEWYYTDFKHQVVADLDSDPHQVVFSDLNGKSFSSSFQIEANMEIFRNFTATLAHRINNVKTTINGSLREKALTNRSKSLVSLSYLTKLKKWQFDFTTQFNGGGRLPDPDGTDPKWEKEFKPYTLMNAQITKNFKTWSVYTGVENLTGFIQKNPIIDAGNPFGKDFDASMVWGPMNGQTFYVGVRWAIDKKYNN
ncbi:conserved exported hypothetical protein [uncultured Paludibacter sp.]|nr:conserved exported hypothetical protein [uncultured Paludibacter sp.]